MGDMLQYRMGRMGSDGMGGLGCGGLGTRGKAICSGRDLLPRMICRTTYRSPSGVETGWYVECELCGSRFLIKDLVSTSHDACG